MKVCSKCNKVKTLSEFYYTNSYRRKYCKLCEHKAQAARRLQKKAKVVELMGGRCVVCGYNESPYALEIDHIDPTKKQYEPSTLVSRRSWDKILKEIKNCQLLCANCHRIKTFGTLTR